MLAPDPETLHWIQIPCSLERAGWLKSMIDEFQARWEMSDDADPEATAGMIVHCHCLYAHILEALNRATCNADIEQQARDQGDTDATHDDDDAIPY